MIVIGVVALIFALTARGRGARGEPLRVRGLYLVPRFPAVLRGDGAAGGRGTDDQPGAGGRASSRGPRASPWWRSDCPDAAFLAGYYGYMEAMTRIAINRGPMEPHLRSLAHDGGRGPRHHLCAVRRDDRQAMDRTDRREQTGVSNDSSSGTDSFSPRARAHRGPAVDPLGVALGLKSAQAG